jgi:hypothetical protein
MVISVENLSKVYRLGQIGTGTFSHDLNVWWAKVRVLHKHPLQMRPRQFVPPAFALALSASVALLHLGWAGVCFC